MRISSNTLFEGSVAAIAQQQARVLQNQQQIATGSRILKPSDDPVAAAQALDLSQADAVNSQYGANRNAAMQSLSLADGSLQAVTSLLQDVRTAALGAGNPTVTDNERKLISTDLGNKLQYLLGLANSTDGLGNYLFSGFQARTQPFVDSAAGVKYAGDDGQRNIQVSASYQMASSDSGADVFMRIRNGNGTFATMATATNAGSGVISIGSVANPALVTGNNYRITFNVAAGVTTYDVTNTTTNTAVSSGNPYVSGQNISFDGLQFDIKGAPANGDTFTVAPSSNESMFKTISDLINVLRAPVTGATLPNALLSGIRNLDNAISNVANASASIGLRLNEIDTLQVAGDDAGLQIKKALSQLQDTDYTKAASELAQQNLILQAAQQSFAKVANLSLFNYL
jgi:flagellar hook-associated protein 3 FlgL